jgi:hypothetical protein
VTGGYESLFSAHVLAAAERVIHSHRLRASDAEHAVGEWEHRPTLSNAIRRDDAKKALFDLSDAYTVALAVKAAGTSPAGDAS